MSLAIVVSVCEQLQMAHHPEGASQLVTELEITMYPAVCSLLEEEGMMKAGYHTRSVCLPTLVLGRNNVHVFLCCSLLLRPQRIPITHKFKHDLIFNKSGRSLVLPKVIQPIFNEQTTRRQTTVHSCGKREHHSFTPRPYRLSSS
jgi:hypothetical protein